MPINFDRQRFLQINESRPNILERASKAFPHVQPQDAFYLNHFGLPKVPRSARRNLGLGTPSETETAVLFDAMFASERLRGINNYNFDVNTGRAATETPPISPRVGYVQDARDRAEDEVQARESVEENQSESVIINLINSADHPPSIDDIPESSNSSSLKRKLFLPENDDESGEFPSQ